MSRANSKTKRGRHLSVRLSETLVSELEAEAARDRRPLSDYVRQVLVAAVTPATQQRHLQQQQQERTNHVSG
jgi:hypothetical protein